MLNLSLICLAMALSAVMLLAARGRRRVLAPVTRPATRSPKGSGERR